MKKVIRLFGILFVAGLALFTYEGFVFAKEGHKNKHENHEKHKDKHHGKHHGVPDNLLKSYLHIREKLANDSLEGIDAEAKKIVHEVEIIKEKHSKHADNPKHKKDEGYQLLTDIGTRAMHLGLNKKIDVVRKHFAKLSLSLSKLVEKIGGPNDKKLFTYYCPMEKVYWIQENKDMANPYYGKKMPKCGNLVEGDAKMKMMHKMGGEKHEHNDHNM